MEKEVRQNISRLISSAIATKTSKKEAIDARMRYLREQIQHTLQYEGETVRQFEKQYLMELFLLMGRRNTVKETNISPINDDDVLAAKSFPIEQLIEFKHGKANAWCHADRTPSLCLWKAENAARCFPCNKTYNPIDVLMYRDSYTFIEAVKQLC